MKLISIIVAAAVCAALPALADEGGRKDNCGQQAKAQGLKGKERKEFMKKCTREMGARHEDEDGKRDRDVKREQAPAQPAPQPSAQTAPAPATPAAAPTQPKPAPAAAPAAPATPAAAPTPAAPATPAAAPPVPAPKPAMTMEQKRQACAAKAQKANVPAPSLKAYMDKCLAG